MRIARQIWQIAAMAAAVSCSTGSGERHSGDASGGSDAAGSVSTAPVQMEPVSQIGGDASAASSANNGGAASASANPTATTNSMPLLTPTAVASTPPTVALTAAQQAQTQLIQSCLVGWDKNPFGPTKTVPDQVLTATTSLLNPIPSVDDTNVTAAPSLILITSNVTLVGVSYKLFNPNGWYCLPTSSSILGGSSVQIKAGAHLSQGGVNVDLSQAATSSPLIPFGSGGASPVQVVP